MRLTLHIDQVFFVEDSFVSMVAEADGDDIGIEVGLIGRKGTVEDAWRKVGATGCPRASRGASGAKQGH